MLWEQTTPCPTPAGDDEVVSLPTLSDVFMLTRVLLHTMFVIDEALDPDRLGDALEKLARMDGWRKLGSRLRKNAATGNLEFSIPKTYSDARPAITRVSTAYGCKMADHHVACHLPKAGSEPALLANVDDYRALWLAPGDPVNLKDLISSDLSAFSIHSHIFTDGTVLVLHWSHALFDAMGLAAVMRSWLLVLQHKEDDVQVPLGPAENPLVDCQKQAKPEIPYALAKSSLGPPAVLRWMLKNIKDLAISRQEVRVFCVPAGLVEKMRAKALAELETESSGTEKPFISEGDILTAWLSRLIHAERPPSQQLLLMNVFDLRKVFAGRHLPRDKFYLGNCVSAFNVLTTAGTVLSKPLSRTAANIRAAIEEQTTAEQAEAYLGENATRKYLPPLFGDSSVKLTAFSNWAKAGFFDLDFSPALPDRTKQRAPGPVKPRYIQDKSTPYHIIPVIIMGKDSSGNYWSSVTLSSKRWKAFEKAVKAPVA